MHIHLIFIHTEKSGPYADIRALYLKRAQNHARSLGVRSIELHNIKSGNGAKSEAERINKLLDKLNPDFIIGLDETGEQKTSHDFARYISEKINNPNLQTLAFVVGGAGGFCPDLKNKFNQKLGLGKMTWPHQLVHVMLTEQIYRAFAILCGSPYHKE